MTQLPIARHSERVPPFKTLQELRSEHSELLRKQRSGDETPPPEVRLFLLRAGATGALLDLDSQRETAQALIDYWTASLYRAQVDVVPPPLEEFNPLLAPVVEEKDCPYVGLDAFLETKSDLFFGRERQVDELVEHLRQHRSVAVLGQSGSGKSSVVMAGLIPALRRGAIAGSDRWLHLGPIVPGSDPIRALAGLFPHDPSAARKMMEHPGALTALLGNERTSLLIVDQFEELFTLCEDRRTAEMFAANLGHLVEEASASHRVVLTMRSDFDTSLPRLPRLQPVFEKRTVHISGLTRQELREAIERPAVLVGLKFDDGLIDKLVEDMVGEPAALPLLQFCLLKLWDRRERNRLTMNAYNHLGGGRRALERTADHFFDEELALLQQKMIAKRILLRIVRVNAGGELVRNRVRKSDIFRPGENREAFEQVLEKLIKTRLVRYTTRSEAADEQIEVAHESLVRNWERLLNWLAQEKSQLMTLQRYEALADDWLRFDRMNGFLDERQVEDAEEWLEGPDAAELGYSAKVREFIEASRARVNEEKVREQARIEEEAAREKARIAAETARVRARLRLRNIAVFTALVIALLVAVVVVVARDARAKAETAELLQSQKNTIELERNRANEAKTIAEELRGVADRARRQAEAAAILANDEKLRATNALVAAKKDQERAIRATALAERRLAIADEHRRKAEFHAAEAQAQKVEADRQRARADGLEGQIARAQQQRLDVKTSTTERLVAPNVLQLGKAQRPLRFGSSITYNLAGISTHRASLGCVVRDEKGRLHLLGFRESLGDEGAKILQPAAEDGGDKDDVIAKVSKTGPNPLRSAAMARFVEDDISFDPALPSEVGSFKGIFEGTVPAGTPVFLLGRDSGLVRTKVKSIDHQDDYELEFVGEPGDTGAPVFTTSGRLIGLVWGTGFGTTWVVPIGTLLDEMTLTPAQVVGHTPMTEEERSAAAAAAAAAAAEAAAELPDEPFDPFEPAEPPTRSTAQTLALPEDLGLHRRQRPLIAGASMMFRGRNEELSSPSSVGWAVRGANGALYLLGLRFGLLGDSADIHQPAKEHGGTDDDLVGKVEKAGDDVVRSAILMRLKPGVAFDPKLAPGVAEITGIQDEVAPGTRVVMIGPNAGMVEATVTGTDFEGDHMIDFSIHVNDSGSPVFTKEGKLIGLVIAPGWDMSWVVPIRTLLREMNVKPEDLVFGREVVTAR